MNSLIERIMAVAGAMPDPAAHRRYLATLSEKQLLDRLATLTGEYKQPATIEFWGPIRRNLQPTL